MPYWRLFYHLVWATKDRLPMIDSKIESRLYSYLTEKAKSMGCGVDAVNGMEDHIHVVISIPPKMAISDVVQKLKGGSSHDFEDIIWQRGYGILSLGERQRSHAVNYVNNQKKHHAEQTTNLWLERCDED